MTSVLSHQQQHQQDAQKLQQGSPQTQPGETWSVETSNTVHPSTEICQKPADRGTSFAYGRIPFEQLHCRAAEEQRLGSAVLKNFLRRLLPLIGRRTSKLKCARVLVTQRKQCHGFKKSKWRIQSTILRHHGRFPDEFIRTSECPMRGSPQH